MNPISISSTVISITDIDTMFILLNILFDRFYLLYLSVDILFPLVHQPLFLIYYIKYIQHTIQHCQTNIIKLLTLFSQLLILLYEIQHSPQLLIEMHLLIPDLINPFIYLIHYIQLHHIFPVLFIYVFKYHFYIITLSLFHLVLLLLILHLQIPLLFMVLVFKLQIDLFSSCVDFYFK